MAIQTLSKKLDAVRWRILLIVGLFILFLCLFAVVRVHTRPVFGSVEAKFTDASAAGLQIVPASCPSNPHWVGECDTTGGSTGTYCSDGTQAPGGNVSNCPGGSSPGASGNQPTPLGAGSSGCTIGVDPSYATAGSAVTLGWSTGSCSPSHGCTFYGAAVTPGNASISGIGNVSPNGQTTITYTPGTTYTLSGNYYAFFVPIDTFSCSVYLSGSGPQTTNTTPPAACPVSNVCSNAATILHVNGDCTTSTVACPYASYGYGCASGGCLTPPPPKVDLTIKPTLVHPGDTVTVEWHDASTAGPSLKSCTVNGTNGDAWSGASGSYTSSPINSQAQFTISCTGIDGSQTTPITDTIDIIPTFQEK